MNPATKSDGGECFQDLLHRRRVRRRPNLLRDRAQVPRHPGHRGGQERAAGQAVELGQSPHLRAGARRDRHGLPRQEPTLLHRKVM